jgi:hypothetical protein
LATEENRVGGKGVSPAASFADSIARTFEGMKDEG